MSVIPLQEKYPHNPLLSYRNYLDKHPHVASLTLHLKISGNRYVDADGYYDRVVVAITDVVDPARSSQGSPTCTQRTSPGQIDPQGK